ncbi:hypothetical protein EVAR_50269_1 [Eumeta japonica]|uniref:Uncharacterized protein n=1 Tax=Eumeta variegata TaxID=151549 RepID=A0A4C1Y565_EUMVA|nr:hypothetical protein EVAR_50269_1 [Eumeta japonica]
MMYEEIIKKFREEFKCEIYYVQRFQNNRQDLSDLSEYLYKLKRLIAKTKVTEENTIIMTFMQRLKRDVKPLFAASAYNSFAHLKLIITSYKQDYSENRESNYELPIERGSREHVTNNDMTDRKATTAGRDRSSNLLASQKI